MALSKRPWATAQNIARTLLSPAEYRALGWYNDPAYLAEELVLTRYVECPDAAVHSRLGEYPDLLHRLMTLSGRPMSRSLAFEIVRWTHAEATFVQPDRFDQRALRIASNLTTEWALTMRPKPRDHDLGREAWEEISSEMLLIKRQLAERLSMALQDLTEEDRRILQDLVIDELPVQVVAGGMGWSVAETERRLGEILQKVREKLE